MTIVAPVGRRPRGLARRSKDGPQARRLLALAASYLSGGKAGKARIFAPVREASGESRLIFLTGARVEHETTGHLFISYSHVDASVMQMFRKHLQGMLRGRMQIWSDQGILRGSEWESLLKGSLSQANAALVLASPDYLISKWCRDELKALDQAHREQRLRYLFWVQLRPCGWQHTELAKFQSFVPSIEQAVSERAGDIQRDRVILQACEEIASEIVLLVTDKDRQLALVRRVLAQDLNHNQIKVNQFLEEGEFAIVCRGSMGGIDVVIKMLRHTPLEKMKNDFVRIGKQRQTISAPAFLRIHKVFPVKLQETSHVFIVSDFLNQRKLSEMLKNGKPVPLDRVGAMLRHAAEAIAQFHRAAHSVQPDVKPDTEWEWTLGFIKPDNIYYDEDANRLQIASFGVSNFLWHALSWDRFVQWVDRDAAAYQLPEQDGRPAEHVTRMADQYFLARLGLELLEGRSFSQILGGKPLSTFWKEPKAFVKGDWKDDHPQLWDLLARMLNTKPGDRWPSMSDVAIKLSGLEESSRALAKRTYRPPEGDTGFRLERNEKFFKSFYARFFRASPQSKKKFENQKELHKNLMGAIVAVLNFREGNQPTSLYPFLEVHKRKAITREEFEKFHACFLETLKIEMKKKPPRGNAKLVKEMVQKWDDLFKGAVDYIVANCADDQPRPENTERTPSDPNPTGYR
jgi:serine/threonine protein kinase